MTPRPPRSHWPVVQGVLALFVGLAVLAGAALYARSNYRSVPHALQQPTPAGVTPIAGWMTVRYVARTYHVPEPLLLQALDVDARQARFRSLSAIAALHHTTTDHVLALVRATVQQYRNRPVPTAAPRGRGQ